jgi:uncharacterized repeat protein (TIGR01451 family)
MLMLGQLVSGTSHALAPLAGSIIRNQASVTFEIIGQPVRIDSNVVSVSVLPVEGLELTSDGNYSEPPGAPVYLPHRLTNTGNVATGYTVDAVNLPGDNYDLSGVVVYRDTNGNGTVDAGEPPIASGDVINLAPGESLDIVISGIIPSTATSEQQAQVRITATSTSGVVTAQNVDTITARDGIAVDVKKSASPQSAGRGEEVTFTITATSRGTSAPAPIPVTVDGVSRNLIILQDVVPVNTEFVAIDSLGFATPLYHRFGDPAQNYTSVPPGDLSQVDAVAVGATAFPVNGTLILTFRVRISAVAAGDIRNIARIFYQDVVLNQVRDVPSNLIQIDIPTAPPVLEYYTDDSYTRIATVTGIGRPLYLQAEAAACNQSPTTVERVVITVASRLTGDVVRYNATETGPNTGIFRIDPPIPTAAGSANTGNDILEIATNDTLIARLPDCGGGEDAVTSILVDPFGVVFNSRTNAPVAGATVTLIDVTGAGNGGNPGGPATVFDFDGVTPAPSTVVTGPDGQFQFPQVQPSTYRLQITTPTGFTFPSVVPPPLLSPGRIIDNSASYGGPFVIAAGGGAVQIDVPIDPPIPAGLFVEKDASRRIVEIADWVDYRIRVRNASGFPVFNATVSDTLPRGFALQSGSVKIDNVAVADPVGAPGPNLIFNVGNLAADDQRVITYRVRVGANAREGENENRARAQGDIVGGTINSNVAAAKVRVQLGVFTTRGVIIGKVFVDVNANKVQDIGEPGIPGVRLYMEDGTFAVTDADGKYSIYGVSAKTHIVKVDRMTLPAGAQLHPLTVKHAGNGVSCFADMKNGELQKINFGEVSATADILAQVKTRRDNAAKMDEARAESDALSDDLNPNSDDANRPRDTRSLPTSGSKTTNGSIVSNELSRPGLDNLPLQSNGTAPPLITSREPFNGAVPRTAEDGPLDGFATPPVVVTETQPLNEILPKLNAELGFVGLEDGALLPSNQLTVRVKGALGSQFKLTVNGEPVADNRLATRAQSAENQVEVWEWIGVRLKTGENVLEAEVRDGFGNVRGSKKITVIVPDGLAKLQISSAKSAYVADGMTPVDINVRLTDDKGRTVSVRTPLTLEASIGTWQIEDLNKTEPGTQVFLEGGVGTFKLLPPQEPAESVLRVSSGVINESVRLSFLPELRPMIAAGVLDASLGFGFNAKSARRSGVGDTFDDDLRRFAESGNNELGARGAAFIKGRIQGKYLLTMRYDSEKGDDNRLFRDIQPDEYYPVYGDTSYRGFDAQSTGRMYVRVDRNRSYVLYGDYVTQPSDDVQALSRYNRSLTGFKTHHETERFSATAFYSRDNSRQVVEELRGSGTSGPYLLGNPNILENSEKVEIIVRDRNQPSVVLRVTPQSRFSDYTVDGLTEGLLFRAPIPAFDADLNPVYIRVSYEVEQGGPKFDIFGFNGQYKVTDRLQLGAAFVKDSNPEAPTSLRALNVAYRLAKNTVVLGEWAQTDRDDRKGSATRLEVQHNGKNLQARFLMGRSSPNFNNPESLLNEGRQETSLRATYRMNGKTRLSGEVVRTEDRLNDVKLTGVQASVERTITDRLSSQFGIRHGSGEANALTATDANTNVEFTSAFARLNYKASEKANLFGRYEKSLSSDSQSFALGGDYQILPRTRAYVVHEFMDAPGGLYALNENNRNYGTRFGVETDYMKNGHAYSEYRMGNGIDGRSAQAAYGLRNMWPLGKGLKVSTLFERTRALGRADDTALMYNDNATAASVGLEWLRGDNLKGTFRLEARDGDNFDTFLHSAGLAYKPSNDVTLLMRSAFANNTTDNNRKRKQGRFQVGMAYRQTEKDRFHSLLKYEYRLNNDGGNFGLDFSSVNERVVHLFVMDNNYQSNSALSFRLHTAMKRAFEKGSRDSIFAYLVSGRIVKELSPRLEASLLASLLNGNNPSTSKYGLGLEIGYRVSRDLLLSAGYNFFDLRDDDLLDNYSGRRGAYVRMRFKFDEDSFGGLLRSDKPAVIENAPGFIPVTSGTGTPVVIPSTAPLGSDTGAGGSAIVGGAQ